MPKGFAFPVNHGSGSPSLRIPSSTSAGGPSIQVFGGSRRARTLKAPRPNWRPSGSARQHDFPATRAQFRPKVIPYTFPFSDIADPDDAWRST